MRATPTEIAADLDAGKVMEAGQLAEVLTHLGVAASASDPVTTDMVTAIRRLRVRAVLTIEGDELRLAIGDGTAPAAAPRAGVADLGPLFVAGAPELAAWARWDIAALVPLIADAVALLDRIEGTAAGRARLAADSEDLGGDLRDLQRDLARAPVRGQMRMDLSDRVRFDVLEHDPPPATPLVRTGLLGLIPPDAPIVSLSAVDGLGDALARSMKQAEDRMAMRSLRELLGSDGVDGAEGMEQAYYRQFAALRQLVLRDARQVFTPPVAYVITTATAIAQLSAETRSPGSRPDRASLADLPIVEYAIVGKATDLDRAVRWLEEVYREAAVTALAIGGGTLPAGAELVARRDLGLGVPTYALSLGWLGAATGGALTVDIRGDLALHAFTRGDFFVISTSVALSRRMLRDDDAPFTLVDPALVTYGRFRSAAITGYLDRLGAWFRVHAPDPGTSSALQAARAALGLVDGLEWWGRDQAGGRLTRAELRFSGSAR